MRNSPEQASHVPDQEMANVQETEQETNVDAKKWYQGAMGDKARALALLMMSALPVSEMKAQNPGPIERTIELTQKAKESASSEWDFPELHHAFIKAEDGTMKFNPWALLAPAEAEISWDNKAEHGMTIEVPYEFSRLFDSGKPLRPEDHAKIVEFITEKVKEQMTDNIHALGIVNEEEVYRYYHPESGKKPEISSIKMTGTASPEALKYGGKSLEPGNIEKENIELANIRANSGKDFVKQALTEAGFDTSSVENIEILPGEEMQLSEKELNTLFYLSSNHEGVDEWDQVSNLVFDYNHGKYEDPVMDDIIGKKRMVKIEVTTKDQNKEVVLVPIPLLPLLLLPLFSIRIRRKLRGLIGREDSNEDNNQRFSWQGKDGQPISKPKTIEELQRITDGSEDGPWENKLVEWERVRIAKSDFGETQHGKSSEIAAEEKNLVGSKIEGQEVSMEKIKLFPDATAVLERIPRFAKEVPLPPVDSEAYRVMQEHTILQDLYDNFDSKETIGYGIDYRMYAEALTENYDEFKTQDERELYVSSFIISAWMGADLTKRKEAGVAHDQLFEGLDYYNSPEQVQWAKMHAKAISELVEERQHFPEKDFSELLDEKASRMAMASKRRELDNQ